MTFRAHDAVAGAWPAGAAQRITALVICTGLVVGKTLVGDALLAGRVTDLLGRAARSAIRNAGAVVAYFTGTAVDTRTRRVAFMRCQVGAGATHLVRRASRASAWVSDALAGAANEVAPFATRFIARISYTLTRLGAKARAHFACAALHVEARILAA